MRPVRTVTVALALLVLSASPSGCSGRRRDRLFVAGPRGRADAGASSCFHSTLLRAGRCALLTQCPSAIRERRRGAWPQMCGFPDSAGDSWSQTAGTFVPLVCCPDAPPGPPPGPWPQPGGPTEGPPPGPRPTPSTTARPGAAQCCPGDGRGGGGGGVPLEPAAESCASLLASSDKEDAREGAARRMCRRYERAACGVSPPTLKATAPSAGEPADRMEFPHMALLGYGSDPADLRWACGGSLIAPDWVLTAAHCIGIGSTPVGWVLLGALFRNETDSSPSPEASSRQVLPVAEVVVHPEYRATGRYHDVALLRLARPAATSRTGVRPACLHTDVDGDPAGSEAVATGWGATGFGEDVSERLIKVSLTVRSQAECRSKISERTDSKLSRGILDGQMCAGGGSEQDTCQGDSGGPLQVGAADAGGAGTCLYRVVGVVSFGPACGIGLPGVYTRVSHYVPWLEAVIWGRGQQAVAAGLPRQPQRFNLTEAAQGTLPSPLIRPAGLDDTVCRSYLLDWCSSSGPLAMQPGLTPRDACRFRSDVGETADPIDYPHMAMLVYGDEYTNEEVGCVGSLISPQYIITAARCATLGCLPMQRALLGVTGGRGSLRSHYRSRSRTEAAVAGVLVHPDYERDRRFNDVALVRLAQAVAVTALVRPACLHTFEDGPEARTRAVATGWEASGHWQDVDGELRRTTLTLRDSRSCRRAVEQQGLPGDLRDSQLCTGGACPNATLPGEPGGPLQVVSRVLDAGDSLLLRVHRLVAMTSLRPPCGRCLPDVHTRVAAFVPWIESVVWPDDAAP
ncbi:hypothetical protein ONE63_011365 [Megalurothrips usitatus]|uniref:Peptidase S1 domain-containing protein n=1 Tax=Megalurothrips usitatus TaxID=439358 RepID=A0AAV7WZI4_9NEOP|nr:hypothetical protein ONE63_011365 [Megalurothrips usitatus]